MKLEELQKKVSAVIDDPKCSAEFYFVLNDGAAGTIKKADIDHAAAAELCQTFIQAVRDALLQNEDLSLVALSAADARENAVYEYDLKDIPVRLRLLEQLLNNTKFDMFDFNVDKLENLLAVLVVLGHGQTQLALYKFHYPVQLIRRDSTLGLVKSKNRLVKLESDVLRIDGRFAFLCIEGAYFVKDLKGLEKFFGFHDAVRNEANQGITVVAATSLIVDATQLAARFEDVRFARKLVRATRNSPVLGVVPNQQVIAFVTSHPTLKGKIRLSADGKQIALDTKVSQNLFLKLLTDDYLHSELTKLDYDSLAKDQISNPP